jgi:hypothetical protein
MDPVVRILIIPEGLEVVLSPNSWRALRDGEKDNR